MRVKNNAEEIFEDRYDGTAYTIKPGDVAEVPAEALVLWTSGAERRGKLGSPCLSPVADEPVAEVPKEPKPKKKSGKKKSGGK